LSKPCRTPAFSPPEFLTDGNFETRIYLVHATRFDFTKPFRPELDAITVLQRDWAERVARAFPPETRWWRRSLFLVQDVGALLKLRLGMNYESWHRYFRTIRQERKLNVSERSTVDSAQSQIDALHGAPLDAIATTLRELRYRVLVDPRKKSTADLTLLLRGLTPEFHRPVRQALREALTTPRQIENFLRRLRPAFSICPADLEPDVLLPRLQRDPAAWFLSLVQCADRARIMETMLNAAVAEAPEHEKLLRVRKSWIAWDRAIGNGQTSDWVLPKESRPPLTLLKT
jgi:hypothetical protein